VERAAPQSRGPGSLIRLAPEGRTDLTPRPFPQREGEIRGTSIGQRSPLSAKEGDQETFPSTTIRQRSPFPSREGGQGVRSAPPTSFAPLSTTIGEIYVAWRGEVIRYLSQADDDAHFARQFQDCYAEPAIRAPEVPPELARGILDHLVGRASYAGPVDLSCLSPFQQRAVERLRAIPRGEVRTYAQLAREIGAPKAARAVGSAMARNPIPLLLPCHRVVRGDGIIGNYGMGGPAVKRALLQLEGVDLRRLGVSRQRHDLRQGVLIDPVAPE
jgi:O-6-methylguanine DNA methyltransferase